MSPALDHVGVVTRDLDALAAQYERLGFQLTPLARHADGRIGNRCAMLRQSYIELLAVVDPAASSATLDRFLARYAGIHILAFAIDDEQEALARLRRAGFDAASVSRFDRAVDDADPCRGRAAFAVVQTPDQPEGRINLVRHLTPEALWQPRFLRHPNNVVTLDEVTLAVGDPVATAARFSRLVGCAVVPDATKGLVLDLARGRVRIVPCRFDGPRITGLILGTSDRNAAIRRLAIERGMPHSHENEAVVVDSHTAGGVVLRFLAAGAARR